jgi:ABC-type Fe3+-hydroxamate transport system substrate-binding protein
LRVHGCHEDDPRSAQQSVDALLEQEAIQGLQKIDTYLEVQTRADKIKNDLLEFLIAQKRNAKRVVAYGAAAKGSTLLNYAGVKPDLLAFACDAAPSKQGRFMPGSHIPIFSPERLTQAKPDYVLILPWNIASEVRLQNASLEKDGTRFVTAAPELVIL